MYRRFAPLAFRLVKRRAHGFCRRRKGGRRRRSWEEASLRCFSKSFARHGFFFVGEKFSGNIAGPFAAGGFRAAMRVQGRWRKGYRPARRLLPKRRESAGEHDSTQEGEPYIECSDMRVSCFHRGKMRGRRPVVSCWLGNLVTSNGRIRCIAYRKRN